MLDVAPMELLLVAIVALLVIGPKDLPKAMRFVGQWVGKIRRTASHFRTGFDAMVREAELEEMEKKWKAENERIMRDHPPGASYPEPKPLPAPAHDASGADETGAAEQVVKPVIRDEPELPLDRPAASTPDRDSLP